MSDQPTSPPPPADPGRGWTRSRTALLVAAIAAVVLVVVAVTAITGGGSSSRTAAARKATASSGSVTDPSSGATDPAATAPAPTDPPATDATAATDPAPATSGSTTTAAGGPSPSRGSTGGGASGSPRTGATAPATPPATAPPPPVTPPGTSPQSLDDPRTSSNSGLPTVPCAPTGPPKIASAVHDGPNPPGHGWQVLGAAAGNCGNGTGGPVIRTSTRDTRIVFRSDADQFLAFLVDLNDPGSNAGYADVDCRSTCSDQGVLILKPGTYRLDVQATDGPWEVSVQEYR